MSAPLEGLKVVELARILAGPWAGQTLADLGADVIKVEAPKGRTLDTLRMRPPRVPLLSSVTNRYVAEPDDIRAKVLEVQEKAGFVPNVFLALARRPAEWRAFFAYHDALMLKEDSGLSKGDREMIVTTTSAANNCLYCVVAHGAILRIYEKKPLVADQVAVNYRKADITPRQSAMLDFAMKVCLHSDQIADADFAALHAHGFNDEDIWDIAAITAFFGLSNRMASFSGMMPNPEFYLMGRLPKAK